MRWARTMIKDQWTRREVTLKRERSLTLDCLVCPSLTLDSRVFVVWPQAQAMRVRWSSKSVGGASSTVVGITDRHSSSAAKRRTTKRRLLNQPTQRVRRRWHRCLEWDIGWCYCQTFGLRMRLLAMMCAQKRWGRCNGGLVLPRLSSNCSDAISRYSEIFWNPYLRYIQD